MIACGHRGSVYPEHAENHPQTSAQIEVKHCQTRRELQAPRGGKTEAREISRKNCDQIGAIPRSDKTAKAMDAG
jgi:hypothetical protein